MLFCFGDPSSNVSSPTWQAQIYYWGSKVLIVFSIFSFHANHSPPGSTRWAYHSYQICSMDATKFGVELSERLHPVVHKKYGNGQGLPKMERPSVHSQTNPGSCVFFFYKLSSNGDPPSQRSFNSLMGVKCMTLCVAGSCEYWYNAFTFSLFLWRHL